MEVLLDLSSIEDYRKFIRIKSLPQYKFQGRLATFPDEYAGYIGESSEAAVSAEPDLHPKLFDYQRDIARIAIRKRKFAVFAECGLGKTLIMLEFARHARKVLGSHNRVLIVSPLMVVEQTLDEAERWYPDTKIEQVRASKLRDWLTAPAGGIGITNYDALTDDIVQGHLGALILDESSMLKSHYGKWGQKCIELGSGLEWKLCGTGTPAPNDRIEYANHAVFLDHFPTVNSFLSRFFVNRGQTDNRWELKPHALEPFYRALSHWAIFLSNPATYGWKDNCGTIPPINVHVEDVELTHEQMEIAQRITGQLIVTDIGGICSRSVMGQLAKGRHDDQDVPTNKFTAIRSIFDRQPNRSTIIWCHYNDEQERCAAIFPDAANIDGSTPHETRRQLIKDFKSGRRNPLISKPKILGFGLNLQISTRQIFSGLQDSYEEFCQAVKRSNRIGSTEDLDVYIPVTPIERPMIETVLRKKDIIEKDTLEQELIFKKSGVFA